MRQKWLALATFLIPLLLGLWLLSSGGAAPTATDGPQSPAPLPGLTPNAPATGVGVASAAGQQAQTARNPSA